MPSGVYRRCSVIGCVRKVNARSLCGPHYMRQRRAGAFEVTNEPTPRESANVPGAANPGPPYPWPVVYLDDGTTMPLPVIDAECFIEDEWFTAAEISAHRFTGIRHPSGAVSIRV